MTPEEKEKYIKTRSRKRGSKKKSLEQIKLEVIQNGIIKTNREVSKISNPPSN